MILQSSLTMLLYFFFIFRRSKQMQTATNAILTGLAVSDLLVMASYVPYAYHTFVRPAIDEHIRFSYGWTLYTLLHANSSVVLHTVSIWLTVLLAVFRYNALRYAPTRSASIDSIDLLSHLPFYLLHHVQVLSTLQRVA